MEDLVLLPLKLRFLFDANEGDVKAFFMMGVLGF